MTVLIIVEHDGQAPRDNFPNTVAAAALLGGEVGDIEALVIGDECAAVAAAAAKTAGVKRVRLAQGAALAKGLAENCAPVIAREAAGCSHIVMAAGALSRSWLARAAALTDSQMISDVIVIETADTFVRPIYAGNALTTVQSADECKFISVRATSFEAQAGENVNAASVAEVAGEEDLGLSEFIGEKVSELTRPELTGAKIVISGGRGVGSTENFKIIEALADKLGAAVGASRAAVDAGYVPNDFQVGQTGKIVAPDLYIAVGISGAIQHIAGIKDAKCIVAINKDPDAPIFDIADYGLVGDLFELVPAISEAIGK
ncbi:MAG: FAD-binding protein [Candidatus Zeuxoniibacter abyssi]|nr:MAG: FAD-binding protein [Candidatus Persebacteraceae bacterium AB1(2)]